MARGFLTWASNTHALMHCIHRGHHLGSQSSQQTRHGQAALGEDVHILHPTVPFVLSLILTGGPTGSRSPSQRFYPGRGHPRPGSPCRKTSRASRASRGSGCSGWMQKTGPASSETSKSSSMVPVPAALPSCGSKPFKTKSQDKPNHLTWLGITGKP